MRLFPYGKKGAITDPVFVGVYILLVSLTIMVSIYVWFQFQDQMEIVVANSPGNATIVETMDQLRASYVSIDYMIPILVGGLMLVSVILAFKTGASIVYAFLSLIFWAIAMLFSALFTNIFEQFETTFPTVASELPILVSIMHNMKWIVLFWLVIISIVMFSRNKQEEQQQVQLAQTRYYNYE